MEEIVGSIRRGSKRPAPGSPERARRASGGEPGAEGPDRGRYSARRKMEAVLRLLRGEELDALSRELGVTASTLSSWREAFLAAGKGGLKSRASAPEQDESRELKTLIGELTIDNEALKALLRAHEDRDPLARRRSRP